MIVAITLLFGGLLALLYAAGKLVSRTTGHDARLLAVAYLALALMLSHASALLSGVLSRAPHLLGWYLPGLLSIGPLLLRFIHVRLSLSNRGPRWEWHLLPALLSVPALVLFLFVDTQSKLALIADIRGGSLERPYVFVMAVTSLHPVLYILFGGLQLARAVGWQFNRAEESVRLLGFLLSALGLLSLLLLVGFLSSSQTLLSMGAILSALSIAALYLLGRRYPGFLDELQVVPG